MKKAIGQTVRDLKRGVNKKVLKVPSIEQKVLDATSNEPWGPHGSLLADIAQATRNYHEYQMIMAVIWKRINDTGKNWRHVYKALTVLEYLVANGSERVIDEIREHAYQISTLSDFQYTDSSGRDQGNNVRRKSQSLVLLVNDNERIAEARQKAAANKDKFRNNTIGGMYRPGSGVYDRYDDDRYGSRDDDRNGYGYGREREWGSRDEDQYSRDGDHYGRDNEDRYSRDGYRGDDYQYGSRSRSSDRDQDHNYDDDGQHSSRGSNAKAEDPSLKGRMDRLERKFSEQNIGAPPSYGEAVGESQSPVHSERDGENSTVSAPGGSPPPINNNRSQTSAPGGSSPVSDNLTQTTAAASIAISANQKVEEAFDEFDPRGAGSDTTNNVEMDLLGSLSESFSSNALVLMPATSTSEANAFPNASSGSAAVFSVAPSVSNNINQAFEDPFGNSPFKAIPSTESTPSQSQVYQNVQPTQSSGLSAETVSNLKLGDSFSAMTYSASGATNTQPFPTNSQFPSQDFSTPQEETDILADILPPAPLSALTSQQDISAASAQSAPPSYSASTNQTTSQSFSVPTSQFVQQSISAPAGQPVQQPFSATTSQHAQPFSAPTVQPLQQPFSSPTGQPVQQPFSAHIGQPTLGSVNVHGGFPSHAGSLIPGAPNITPQSQNGYNGQLSGSFLQRGTAAPFPSNMASQTPTGHMAQRANYFPQQGVSTAHSTSLMAPQSSNSHASQFNSGGFNGQQGGATPFSSPITHQTTGAPGGNQSNNVFGNLFGQAGTNAPHASQYSVSSSAGSNALVPHQPSKDKFETKSTVWVDTLSRGLVDLNISGPKTNPLADIGIDFDAINRKEKRMEKPATTSVTSTVTMGKAMGSGSGIGRAGAGALRPPANPMMGSGMGMGMGNGPGVNMSMGIGGYEGINPSMGMGGMGMDMNMGGMGQGFQMQQPTGFPSGSNPPGNYNSMMGPGSYAQQPYGGGY